MISNIYNQNFGYTTTCQDNWSAVGNPSILRFNPLTASLIKTGSVEIYKYNINTDTHDKMAVIYRPLTDYELVLLAADSASANVYILHTEPTGSVVFSADLDLQIDEGKYYSPQDDGYGFSIDINNNLLAVGNPYFSSGINVNTANTFSFTGSGYVDMFDLSKFNIDPYAQRTPPVIVNYSFGTGFALIGVSVPGGQSYRYVSIQTKRKAIPNDYWQTIVTTEVSELGGLVFLQTNYTSYDLIDLDVQVVGIVGADPYLVTIPNPNIAITESFGWGVSMNDEWLAVSSIYESGSKGGVYIYQKYALTNDSWSLYQPLTLPSDIVAGDMFGFSLDMNKSSGSYNYNLVVGTARPTSSKAYVYELVSGSWIQKFTLSPDNTTVYPLTFYPTLPLFSGSYPNTADSFGYDVATYGDTIMVGAPTDRYIYEYSGSSVYQQGAVYFYQRCGTRDYGYYLARKSYGNEKTMKNNMLGFSVGVFDNYAVAGVPKITFDQSTICFLQGSLFQKHFCESSNEETLNGQYILYQTATGSISDSTLIDWDIINVYQVKKRYLQPHRAYGFDVSICDKFIIVGAPMLIYGENTIMSFYKDPPPTAPILLSVASGSAILSWSYDNTNSEHNGFNVEKSTNGFVYSNLITIANTDSRSHIDNYVTLNNTYWYRVNAYNELGVSPYSNILSIFLIPPAPDGSTVLEVSTGSMILQSLGSGSSILSWSYTGAYQNGFTVEKSSSVAPGYTQIVNLATPIVRSYSDSNIDANEKYFYRVQPYNSYGTGSYSNIGSASFSNILYFSGSSKFYINPSGFIAETESFWKGVYGYKNVNMTRLNVSSNSLSVFNLVGATALTQISCSNNQLTSLDLNTNPVVTRLYCQNNFLTHINTSNCNLFHFYCYNNQLSSLDVTQCVQLELFNCNNNLLTSLDLSQNTLIDTLDFSHNQLNYIDVSQIGNLRYIYGHSNVLTGSNFSGPHNRLYYIGFSHNLLTTGSINLDTITTLDELDLKFNLFTDFEHIGPPSRSLTAVGFSENPLTTSFLDMTMYPSASYLYADGAHISSSVRTFVSNSYIYASIYGNQFPTLDLQHTPSTASLTFLDVSINNYLTSLDTSYCVSMSTLICHQNFDLADKLVISGSALTFLFCGNSSITNLILSGSPNLTTVWAHENSLTVNSINQLYIDLDTFGLSSGNLILCGSLMASPTGAGITARNNLVGKSWTIRDESGIYP